MAPESFKPGFKAPKWILLLLLPALPLAFFQWQHRGRVRIDVVGSGAVHQVSAQGAPEGFRYVLDTFGPPSLQESQNRLTANLSLVPQFVVFGSGLSPAELTPATIEASQASLAHLAQKAHNATVVSLFVGPVATSSLGANQRESLKTIHNYWKEHICRAFKRLHCFDPWPYQQSPPQMQQAFNQAVVQAYQHLDQMRATTQVRR